MRRVVAALLLLAACGDDARRPTPAVYDRACPDGPDCPDHGTGVLWAGAAKETITPTLVETEWQDLNHDNYWQPNEPFTDVNGNGKFDAFWIPGWDPGRVVSSIHDDGWVRAIALRYNETTVVFVTLDVIGYFKDEMDKVRARLPKELGVDLVVMSATHVHETVNTIGLWGPTDQETGLKADYMEYVRAQSVKAITEAVGALQPANLTIGQIIPTDNGDPQRFAIDTRDPIVADTTMSVLRFNKAGEPAKTIATWIIWQCHPIFAWEHNNAYTSDFPGTLRETVESIGYPAEGLPPLGGIAMYSSGAIGGHMGTGSGRFGVEIHRDDGTVVRDDGTERSDLAGKQLARYALKALQNGAETMMTAPLRFRTKEILADVDNYRFHTAFLLHLVDRQLYGYDPTQPIARETGNIPQMKSEVTHIELGDIGIATFPGELFPELYVGGFDGSRAAPKDFIDPTNPNPPMVANAPKGPYLRDLLLARPGIKWAIGLGLAQDFVGYIVPKYDFKLDPDDPYFTELGLGDHYEETYSVGPLGEEQLVGPLRTMIPAP